MAQDKKKIAGIIITVIGLIMILISALNYIFNWEIVTTAYSAIGIVNVAIGTGLIRKSK